MQHHFADTGIVIALLLRPDIRLSLFVLLLPVHSSRGHRHAHLFCFVLFTFLGTLLFIMLLV